MICLYMHMYVMCTTALVYCSICVWLLYFLIDVMVTEWLAKVNKRACFFSFCDFWLVPLSLLFLVHILAYRNESLAWFFFFFLNNRVFLLLVVLLLLLLVFSAYNKDIGYTVSTDRRRTVIAGTKNTSILVRVSVTQPTLLLILLLYL